jgi:acyl carrier protein
VTALEAQVVDALLGLAREALALEGAPPGPEEPLAGRLDSLQLLTLAVAVEDRFHVILTDDEAAEASTLLEVARLVIARADPLRLPGSQAAEAG